MKIKQNLFSFILSFLFSSIIYAQNEYQNVLDNPDLLHNVNSLVLQQTDFIDIVSQNGMSVKHSRKVLVLNELGIDNIDAFLYYDPNTKIKNLQLSIFDLKQKKPLKVIKEKEFKDYNASDGFSIVTDNRIKTAKYQHLGSYPFIAEFVYEYTTSNTAHIPGFHPYSNAFETVLNHTYQINFDPVLGFQKLEKNLANYPITSISNVNSVTYTVTNLKYNEREDLSLSYSNTIPHVIFGLNKFNLEGVNADITSWDDFGKWYYTNFIQNFSELTPQTIIKVKELTNHLSDPIEKAKVLYEYMQSKTRYISIQLGIGGWKPFPAKYVDQKGFGDCKALSNYMHALLKAANVESYITIVKAGDEIENIYKEIVSTQGNHMILALPTVNNQYVFLECTSQTNPFGHISGFTDGRDVLIIKPTGGEIYKTPILLNSKNHQNTEAKIKVGLDGTIATTINILNTGEFYDSCLPYLKYEKEDMNKVIKSQYSLIKQITDLNYTFKNDKDLIVFTENYQIKTNPILQKMGNQFILPLNMIHPITYTPKNYKNRNFDFSISRGFSYTDNIEIELPNDVQFLFIPESKTIKSEFGEYSIHISQNNHIIKLKRTFTIFANQYEKSKYKLYKDFRDQIAQLEAAKLTYKI